MGQGREEDDERRSQEAQGYTLLGSTPMNSKNLSWFSCLCLLDGPQTWFVEDTGTPGVLLLLPVLWGTLSVGVKSVKASACSPRSPGAVSRAVKRGEARGFFRIVATCVGSFPPSSHALPITHLSRHVVFNFRSKYYSK